jgi:hypothetical protein
VICYFIVSIFFIIIGGIMNKSRKMIIRSLVFFCLIISQTNVNAMEFLPLDSLAISTGGAGVASASSSFGSYYNPALLAHHQTGFEWVTSVGAGIREFNLADHIDKLADVDINDTIDEIENEIQGIVWMPNTFEYDLSNDQIANDVKIIKRELGQISDNNGLQIMPNVSVGFQFGNIGIGLFSMSELTAIAIIDDTRLDFIVKADSLPATSPYRYVKYDENAQKISLTDEQAYERSSIDYAINNANNDYTYLKLKGITYYEIPIAYGRNFSTPFGNLSLGGSLKFMPGYTYEKVVKVDTESGDIADEFDDGAEHQDTAFGLDLGFLYTPNFMNNRLVTGMVVKNINSPTFESKSGFEYTIDPQIRAGLLYHIWRDTLMVSMDYDFSENESILSSYTSQNIGGGIQFKPSHMLSLRCGVQKNMKSNDNTDEGTIFTAGLALGLKWLKIDLSGQYSTETTEFDGNEIPSSGRVQLSLVSNLFYGKRTQPESQYQDVDQRDVVQDAVDLDEEKDSLPEDEQIIEPTDIEEMPEEKIEEKIDTDESDELLQKIDNIETAVPDTDISPTVEQAEPTQYAEPEVITTSVKTEKSEPEVITKSVKTEKPEPEVITKSVETEKSEPIVVTKTVEPEVKEKPIPCPTNNIQSKMQETINITTAIDTWSKSWSSMDVNAYLDNYSSNFKPSKGLSLSAWKKQRKKRLKKEFIKIDISNISIEFTACKKAKVTFDQKYESPGYKDHTKKMLLFEKMDSRWLIQKEGSQ